MMRAPFSVVFHKQISSCSVEALCPRRQGGEGRERIIIIIGIIIVIIIIIHHEGIPYA